MNATLCFSTLFVISAVTWIAIVIIHRLFDHNFAQNQTFGGRVGRALGFGIHQALGNNNGWWLVLATMAFISCIAGIRVNLLHLPVHVAGQERESYLNSPWAQKVHHKAMENVWREDTKEEKETVATEVAEYHKYHDHWPWLKWCVVLSVITLFFTFYALSDEIMVLADDLRMLATSDQSASGPVAEGIGAAIVEWLRHRPVRQVSADQRPSAPTVGTDSWKTIVQIFNVSLFADLMFELARKAFAHFMSGRIH